MTSFNAAALSPSPSSAAAPEGTAAAAIRRLSALTPLDQADLARLDTAAEHAQTYPLRHTFQTIGRPMADPLLLLQGWAARVRILPDGRRQFMSFYLPGDIIGTAHHARPIAPATVVAITECVACPAPAAPAGSGLAQAYAVGEALDQAYLLGHVVQLGRLNAQERIGDLLLELYERLTLSGSVSGNGFDLPLTQETLADALGLTSVHVNRMLQQARREGDLNWRVGHVRLSDPAGLARKIGHVPVRVTAY